MSAVDLLCDNIHALQDPDFGTINLLPWSYQSDQNNAIKRKVCQAIVQLFQDNGYPMEIDEAPPVEVSRTISMNCRQCSTELLTLRASDDGVANIPAASVISAIGSMNPECPHDVMTADDHRKLIEDAAMEFMNRDEA